MDPGYPHPGFAWEGAGDLFGCALLDPEVELVGQAVGELSGQLADAVLAAPGRPVFDQAGQLVEHRQVPGDRIGDAGTLHFHDDSLAALEPGLVDLPDRSRCQRFPIELVEDGIDPAAQLGFQQRADLLRVRGRDRILQLGKFGAGRRRKQVCAGGGHLAELDEDPAAVLEHPADADGCRDVAGLVIGPRAAEAQRRAEAVPRGDPGDLGVAGHPLALALGGLDRAWQPGEPGLCPGQRAGP